MKIIAAQNEVQLMVQRLALQVLEYHDPGAEIIVVGIQPRGVFLSNRIVAAIQTEEPGRRILYGILDITFYRDDLRKEMHLPNKTEINFSVEGKIVVLVDDVLYTGRTVRAAMDALMDFGRPKSVQLLSLIDRRLSREVPIQANYTGKVVDSILSQKVKVLWQEKDGRDEVQLLDA